MAFTNHDEKEINCKVVYFGCKGSGKSENLRSICKKTNPDLRSGLMDFDPSHSDKYGFEFLPVSMGFIEDYHLKIHLYTLPKIDLFATTTSVFMKGIDGYVSVFDSGLDAMMDNVAEQKFVRDLLVDYGYNIGSLPKVVQFNKRDLSVALPINLLRAELNPAGLIDHEAVATESIGTLETLESLSKQILQNLL